MSNLDELEKKMAWLSATEGGEKVLHVWHQGRWMNYARTPHALPDARLEGIRVSKGYRTMQSLLKQGWFLVPTVDAEAHIKTLSCSIDNPA